MKRAMSDIASLIGFLNAKNLPVKFVVFLMLLSATSALFAQRDVHASLIAAANRKPAPQSQLISETGKATQLSDYRGKAVLLNFWPR